MIVQRVFLLFLILCLSARLSAQAWEENYSSALERAGQEQKKVILLFSGSDWCKSCMKWDLGVFGNPAFDSLASQEYILYRADFPRSRKNQPDAPRQADNQHLASQYNPEGVFPRAVLLSPNGSLLGTLEFQEENSTAFFHRLGILAKNDKQ